jgi:hypothetical protein
MPCRPTTACSSQGAIKCTRVTAMPELRSAIGRVDFIARAEPGRWAPAPLNLASQRGPWAVANPLRTWVVLTVAGMLGSFTSLAAVPPAPSVNSTFGRELAASIMAVKRETGSTERAQAAQRVAKLVIDRLGPGDTAPEVDGKIVLDLASLLDTTNDNVRLWVATSLGFFGSRAKFAVPKLLTILHEVDCASLRGMNSAGAIRIALTRINGVSPPTPDCTRNRGITSA